MCSLCTLQLARSSRWLAVFCSNYLCRVCRDCTDAVVCRTELFLVGKEGVDESFPYLPTSARRSAKANGFCCSDCPKIGPGLFFGVGGGFGPKRKTGQLRIGQRSQTDGKNSKQPFVRVCTDYPIWSSTSHLLGATAQRTKRLSSFLKTQWVSIFGKRISWQLNKLFGEPGRLHPLEMST